MRRTFASPLALLLATMLLAAACGGDSPQVGGSPTQTGTPTETGSPTEGEGGTITIAGREANDHGSLSVAGQDEIDLELGDFFFQPTLLQGQAGQSLTIELRNQGTAPHNFSLTEQSLDQDLEAGEDAKVTVTFPDSGMLAFFCKFHAGQGMVGGLSV
jgi:plastocyanin